jgi:hypothetical protein
MKHTLIFHHIPKTAGSTMRQVLRSQYKKVFEVDGYDPQSSIDSFKGLSREQQIAFDVIQGHAAFPLADFADNPVFLTYLREPVDCFVSQYYYIKRTPWHRTYQAISSINSIAEYADFALRHHEDNIQTRFLADTLLANFGPLRPQNPVNNMEILLNQAKKRLQTIKYVFFTHQFDLSLQILKHDLQWQNQPYYLRLNKTRGRPAIGTLDKGVIATIKEAVRYDIQLFEFAKALNAKLLANYDLDEQLANFQRNNIRIRPLLKINHYRRGIGRRIVGRKKRR